MGMEREIAVPQGVDVAWQDIAQCLQEHNYPVEMRMIDNELAFPDETPPDNWKEIRLGTPPGMITIRRSQTEVGATQKLQVVIWGNAEEEMLAAWNVLTWACAEAVGGLVVLEDGSVSAIEFRNRAKLPESFSK